MSLAAGLDATVTAVATHPAGAVLDEHGHPVLDGNGDPTYRTDDTEENR